MRILTILLLTSLLLSCIDQYKESDIYGYYTPVGYKNNFDTLQLKPKGVYHRKVYDVNKKIILEMDGEWKLEGRHRLLISSLYINLDDDLVKYPELACDTDMELSTYFETHSGIIQFCGVGHHPDENCYQKVEEQ